MERFINRDFKIERKLCKDNPDLFSILLGDYSVRKTVVNSRPSMTFRRLK